MSRVLPSDNTKYWGKTAHHLLWLRYLTPANYESALEELDGNSFKILCFYIFRWRCVVMVLTKDTGVPQKGSLLTNKRDVPFILCFKYPLERKYTLAELEKKNNKELQSFLDKVSRMTVQQVDKVYARKPDKNDTFNGFQVYHYAVTDSFRIHVINEAGRYKIIRLGPHHTVHK